MLFGIFELLVNVFDDFINVILQAGEDVTQVSLLILGSNLMFWLVSEPALDNLDETLLLRLLGTDAHNGLVLDWNLLCWERWRIGESKTVDFSDFLVYMGDVLLSPGSVGQVCHWIEALDVVEKAVLLLVDITYHVAYRTKVGNACHTVLVVYFNLRVLIIVVKHEVFSLILAKVIVIVIFEAVTSPSRINVANLLTACLGRLSLLLRRCLFIAVEELEINVKTFTGVHDARLVQLDVLNLL